MGFRVASTDVREDWVRSFSSTHTNLFWKGGTVPAPLAESRTVFIPKSSDVDNDGRLTLCNCDCTILTTANCVDFQRLSQIIANLTREILAEREAEIGNLLGDRRRNNALAKCRLGLRAWACQGTYALPSRRF